MSLQFITRLTREAESKDFRVLTEDGGFQRIIDDLLRRSDGELFINAQRDYTTIYLKIFVIPALVSQLGTSYRFDGFNGEILDFDGKPTGNFVRITMGIDTAVSHSGGTAGVLRMERLRSLPNPV